MSELNISHTIGMRSSSSDPPTTLLLNSLSLQNNTVSPACLTGLESALQGILNRAQEKFGRATVGPGKPCPQWHGLFLGIVYSTTVMVQKRFLIINSSSSFALILLHRSQPGILEPAAFRNLLECLPEAQWSSVLIYH